MKTFNEYRKAAGYFNLPEMPKQERIIYAYKDGEVREYATVQEAKQFSQRTEIAYKSSPARDHILEMWEQVEQKAYEAWYSDLRDEWSELSDAVFDICYSKAYEDGHSAGYDEVSNCMHDIVALAERIIQASSITTST